MSRAVARVGWAALVDKDTRNAIERATQRARKILEEDFSAQLEGTFDVLRTGVVAPNAGAHLSARQVFQRDKIIAAIEHKRAAGMPAAGAIADYLRDAAFTTLNRFVALKMLEVRELVKPCISKGELSPGYIEFCGMAPGVALLPEGAGYRLYIESLFDELSTEIKVLFDRRDPASVLWPKRATFDALLDVLNVPELAGVWNEDETIGWVYQFFNSGDERKRMREESQAPRNSRELAIRNQFFTPRFVVRFLTDCTLGRIWYEMREGATRLSATCKYMLQRRGESVPPRAMKDPRDLRILDPACGSGHFLLYAFDLLLVIYEEAWADSRAPKSEVTGRRLVEDYPDLVSLRIVLPGLVLRHNLFGIDIDPRCAQIAQLALWMRAQRALRDFGVAQRPPISKTNVVVAEPMPGESHLREEFIRVLEPKLGALVARVFEKMLLAGEAGSLLKIEREIRSAIRETYGEAGELFQDADERRWTESERQLLGELEKYAGFAQTGTAYRRHLFAEDAARGLSFIDLCRARYDVILMNPPFGEFIDARFDYLDAEYTRSKRDLAIAFVDRAFELAGERGFVGALHSRKPLFLDTQQSWREAVAERWSFAPLADLGHRVLDNALVEVAATVFRPSNASSVFIDCLDAADKDAALMEALEPGRESRRIHVWTLDEFAVLPSRQFAYAAPRGLLEIFRRFPSLDPSLAFCRDGLSTRDNYRFLRLHWEVSPSALDDGWARLAKGGEYSPYYLDAELVVPWQDGRGELAAHGAALGNEARSRQGSSYYFRPSLTYTERTASRMSVRLLPVDAMFTTSGPGVVLEYPDDAGPLLGLLNSHLFSALYELCIGGGDSVSSGAAARHYTPGGLGRMPVPSRDALRGAGSWPAMAMAELQMAGARENELSPVFSSCEIELGARTPLARHAADLLVAQEERLLRLWDLSATLEDCALNAYGLDETVLSELEPVVGPHAAYYPDNRDIDHEAFQRLFELDETALIGEVAAKVGNARYVVVKSYIADRRYELLAHYFRTHPRNLIQLRRDLNLLPPGHLTTVAHRVMSLAFGRIFGRWAKTPMPAWTPEQLLASGYPRRPPALVPCGASSVSTILVDDPGHPLDVLQATESLLREGFEESCLLVQSIRHLQRNDGDIRRWLATDWFDRHLSHYSLHRRKAPVYWQLATTSSAYSVWISYEGCSSDTLYKVQHEFVAPKLAHEERKLASLRAEAGPSPSNTTRKRLAQQDALVDELRGFLDDLKRIAPLWKPTLNDGVIINFAPLWRLVAHKAWRKELRTAWDCLVAGDYDWAHLAMLLWPERVVPKCATDRSLAIAHNLDDAFWIEGTDGKWKARATPVRAVDELVRDRTSAAMKGALKNLLDAPAAAGTARVRGRRAASASATEEGNR